MFSGLLHQVNKAKFLLNDNSTTLLTAVGVAGTVSTAVLTGRATFKAAEIIAKEEQLAGTELHVHDMDEEKGYRTIPASTLSKTEKVKLVWRLYLPPVASGVLTITCIIVANKISSKKIAALTIAGGISERALQEYKDKVVEKLGPKQDQKIRDEIAQERVDKNPNSREVVIASGEVLCYDMLTGRYFNSTMEDIKRAENRINYELLNHMAASLSMFYEEIGLPPTTYTDTVGWNSDHRMEVQFSTVLSEDKRPCIAIDFSKPPVPDYDRFYN
jgi:hypothetical protein